MPETNHPEFEENFFGTDVADREREPERTADEWTRDASRISLGGHDLRLAIDGELDPNLAYRWCKDEGDSIHKRLTRGYRPVLKDMSINYAGDVAVGHDQWICKKTGRLDTGAPQVSYLMAIKKEWYDEDQDAKDQMIQGTEQAILAGSHEVGNEPDKMYLKEARIQNFRR